MMFDQKDLEYLDLALDLAYKGQHTTKPNPAVGCVIVKKNKIIGTGWHEKAGSDHAEIQALKACNFRAKDSTCYVTLEPCAHYGKTPPCVDALIKAEIKKVVIITLDCNKLVNNKSIIKLKEHNIAIHVLTDISSSDQNYIRAQKLISKAYELNKGFFKRMKENKPWVVSKIATSLDGKIALKNGYSKWITGERSRADVHVLRASMSAIITTSRTVLKDNAKLNPRINPELNSNFWPIRVVLDQKLKTSVDNAIYQLPGKVLLFTDKQDKAKNFIDKGISVHKSLELKNLIKFLAEEYQCNQILFEAGSILNTELLKQRLLDELIVYQSSKVLGSDGIDMFNVKNVTKEQLAMDFTSSLVDNLNYFKLYSVQAIGDDIKLIYR